MQPDNYATMPGESVHVRRTQKGNKSSVAFLSTLPSFFSQIGECFSLARRAIARMRDETSAKACVPNKI